MRKCWRSGKKKEMAKEQFDIDKVCWMIRGAYAYAKDEKWIMKPLAWALYEVWKIVDKWEKENENIRT